MDPAGIVAARPGNLLFKLVPLFLEIVDLHLVELLKLAQLATLICPTLCNGASC